MKSWSYNYRAGGDAGTASVCASGVLGPARLITAVRRFVMRPRIYIPVAALLFFVSWGLVAGMRSIAQSAPQASFSFLGYTNDSSGQRFAIVTITNEDRFPIKFVSVGAYVWFDSTNSPVGASVLPLLEGTDLFPGKSRTFCVEMPAGDVRRAVELWVRRATATENLKERLHKLSWRIPDPNVYGLRSPFIIK
jgi:hypothetical protein